MAGRQGFNFQGIHYADRQSRLDKYCSAFPKDMAGNAFNVRCCAAIMLVKELLLAQASLLSAGPPPALSAAACLGSRRCLSADLQCDSDAADVDDMKPTELNSCLSRSHESLLYLLGLALLLRAHTRELHNTTCDMHHVLCMSRSSASKPRPSSLKVSV